MSKSKYLISIVVILIPVFLGVRYFLTSNFQPETKVSQLPLVMDNYYVPSSRLADAETIKNIKTENLNLVTAIISANWPTLKEAAVITDSNFSFIADYNLTVASGHDDFISYANLNSESIDSQSSITSLLEDESYQKYVQVVPGWHYNIYLTFEHSPDTEPSAIIINNQSYSLIKVKTFYLVTDYFSEEAAAIGLRPADSGVTIRQAVAVTGQIPSRVYNPKRLSAKEADLTVSTDDSKLKINSLENNRYLLTEVLSDYQITKIKSDQSLGQISYFGYKAADYGFAQIEFQQSHKLFFLKESGDYQISDLRRQNQAKRVGEVTIIAFLIIIFLIFYHPIVNFLKRQTTLLQKEVYQPIAFYAKNHLLDLIILTLSVNTLVVLRGNPLVGPFLTPTNIFILFIFGLILIARLSLKVVVSLTIALLLISAFLAQFRLTDFMDKVAVYMYFLLMLLIIVLAATQAKKIQED